MRRALAAVLVLAGCSREAELGWGTPVPTPDPVPRTWRSWEVVLPGTDEQALILDTAGEVAATLRFYESMSDGGVDVGAYFPQFTAGLHPTGPEEARDFWHGTGTKPYAGRSAVGRDSNEPPPIGAFDLQLHPATNDHNVVAAFVAPLDGLYEVRGLAARSFLGGLVLLTAFDAAGQPKTTVLTDESWSSPIDLAASALTSGDTISFGVTRYDNNTTGDATEIAWTIHYAP